MNRLQGVSKELKTAVRLEPELARAWQSVSAEALNTFHEEAKETDVTVDLIDPTVIEPAISKSNIPAGTKSAPFLSA